MSKYSSFNPSPYTHSTNSQFNPKLYNKVGAVTGCVGTKDMSGGANVPTSSYYGLKTVDAGTASMMRGSYAPIEIQSHSQCAGSRKKRKPSKKMKTNKRKHGKSKKCCMCPCCKCKCPMCNCKMKKRKYSRRVKKIRMKGGTNEFGSASYTTLAKLSPSQSMMANPIPFSKTNNCVDNYNHFNSSPA